MNVDGEEVRTSNRALRDTSTSIPHSRRSIGVYNLKGAVGEKGMKEEEKMMTYTNVEQLV